MRANELFRILKALGCTEIRKSDGSHRIWQCGACKVSIPDHKGQDIGYGLLKAIEKDLAPCLGKGWLRKHGY